MGTNQESLNEHLQPVSSSPGQREREYQSFPALKIYVTVKFCNWMSACSHPQRMPNYCTFFIFWGGLLQLTNSEFSKSCSYYLPFYLNNFVINTQDEMVIVHSTWAASLPKSPLVYWLKFLCLWNLDWETRHAFNFICWHQKVYFSKKHVSMCSYGSLQQYFCFLCFATALSEVGLEAYYQLICPKNNVYSKSKWQLFRLAYLFWIYFY